MTSIIAYVIGVPLAIYFMTRGWTPPKPGAWSWFVKSQSRERERGPSTDDLVDGFYERIATNAELTRAAAEASEE